MRYFTKEVGPGRGTVSLGIAPYRGHDEGIVADGGIRHYHGCESIQVGGAAIVPRSLRGQGQVSHHSDAVTHVNVAGVACGVAVRPHDHLHRQP